MIETMIIEMMELLPFFMLGKVYSPFHRADVYPEAPKYGVGSQTMLGGGMEGDAPNQGTGIVRQNPTSRMSSIISTGNIDFSNTDQVKQIQKALGITADGVFGPQTEAAYQDYINKRRVASGKDAYGYGTENQPPSSNLNLTDASGRLFTEGDVTDYEGNIVDPGGQSYENTEYSNPNYDPSNDPNYADPNKFESEYVDPNYADPNKFETPYTQADEEAELSPAELRAKKRAESGEYVWNKGYRDKYSPGTSLWDFLK